MVVWSKKQWQNTAKTGLWNARRFFARYVYYGNVTDTRRSHMERETPEWRSVTMRVLPCNGRSQRAAQPRNPASEVPTNRHAAPHTIVRERGPVHKIVYV